MSRRSAVPHQGAGVTSIRLFGKDSARRRAGRQLAGYVSVDTAACVIGDPFHLANHAKRSEDAIQGSSLLIAATGTDQLRHEQCLVGVCVETGFSDGVYPVYVDFVDVGEVIGCRIAAAHIVFFDRDELSVVR